VNRALGIAAAALGATAVALGAFGAHALRSLLDDNALSIWHTAVDYQFWHALAVLAIAGFAPRSERWWPRAGWTMVAGCAIFVVSLYALVLGAPRWIGAVTPLGGILLIAGWIASGIAFWCTASSK
jgi:uncharacterized membrane protein YgdD (TMEM256/DUF423 family)